ncbi:hypothetical protein HZ326_22520 [Fusarium oxysporum f. sp. albedinis]|nr:hypothetical protein HZ326_22520 [Fusarium oxysporum f. sp. albedinis]
MVSYEQRYALHRGYWWFVTACGASGVHGRQFKGLDSYFTGYQPPQVDPHYWASRATNCAGLHPVPDAINGAQTIVEDSGETEQSLLIQNSTCTSWLEMEGQKIRHTPVSEAPEPPRRQRQLETPGEPVCDST